MELRYRRKMKMPVWSLPGFETGFEDGYSRQYSTGKVNSIRSLQSNYFGTSFGYPYQQPSWTTNSNWQPDLGWQPKETQIPKLNTNINMNLTDGFSTGQTLGKPNIAVGTTGSYQNQKKEQTIGQTIGQTVGQTIGQTVGQTIGQKINNNNNNNNSPGTPKGGGLNAQNAGQIAMSAINLGFATADSFGKVKKDNELYADAGQSTGYGAGYNFVKQNRIDEAREMSDLNAENQANTLKTAAAGVGLGTGIGVAIGGIAGPIGAAAGAILSLGIGLFGSRHRKRKLRKAIYNAQQDIIRKNTFSNASAQTDYLTQNYYNKYGNPYDDQIYNAKYGKDADGWKLPDGSVKGKAREFNRKLSLPNIKEND